MFYCVFYVDSQESNKCDFLVKEFVSKNVLASCRDHGLDVIEAKDVIARLSQMEKKQSNFNTSPSQMPIDCLIDWLIC